MSPALVRCPHNPILTRADLPDVAGLCTDATSVFNPGAVRFRGRDRLLLRVQARSRETFLFAAKSEDGIRFSISPEPVRLEGIERVAEPIYHVYDPRITLLDDACYVMVAMDMETGCRLGVARTEDFRRFEFLGLSGTDTRNGVLFPQRFGSHFLRLERPNRVALEGGPTSGDEIVLSHSNDLVSWRQVAAVMSGRPRYWDELIGSGPPPVKTREGWLHVYHGVATHFQSSSIYQAGVVLLDLEDPATVVARSRHNVLEPREPYELIGQVPNVVFPGGMIVAEQDDEGFAMPDSAVRIYYGAADTCVGLATTTVGDLLEACRE